ncbi:hypothetical protein C2G38_2149739 [Gigaspora rosea]|uniref:Uncharacterized protein n=1 Tax=Gigaspora rosea TaxID=44941 RepID=A0A397U1S9_9GLOM|nr:hypothetical protein C2G38_2149739 [Gigaspora rosea]
MSTRGTFSNSLPIKDLSDKKYSVSVNLSQLKAELISLEDKKIDEFLDSKHKEKVSEEIIQSIKEKKLREQDLSLVNQMESEKIIPLSLCDAKTVTKYHDQNYALILSDTISIEISESNNQIVEGLIQEMTCNQTQSIVSPEINSISSKSCIQDMIPGSVQSLSDLFDKAIKSGQKQILCWYYYSLEFENKIKILIADGKIKNKTARSKIYKEMKPFLPNITDVNLRKKTERARKILKLFGEGGVAIDKINYVTYSASTISGLKDTQIQHIINQVASKTVTKCHNQNNSKVNESTTTPIPSDLDNLPKAKILTKSSSEARVSASSISPSNLAHDRTYLCNEALAQYPDLYCQFSS